MKRWILRTMALAAITSLMLGFADEEVGVKPARPPDVSSLVINRRTQGDHPSTKVTLKMISPEGAEDGFAKARDRRAGR